MATCSILAWRIPRTEEPGRLQSIGSHRVGHNRATEHTHARRDEEGRAGRGQWSRYQMSLGSKYALQTELLSEPADKENENKS